jgi:hypothetical protein
MSNDRILNILRQLEAREIDAVEARRQLGNISFVDITDARIDYERPQRCGFPEVIFGQAKSVAQLRGIIIDFVERGENVLVTRLDAQKAAALTAEFPEADYQPESRMLALAVRPPSRQNGRIAVVTAGTSDKPVALEAVQALEFFGFMPNLIQDVGVAGIHRLMACRRQLEDARVVIVVAGMEGALASVVGGLIRAPIIAVPTSVGYGASFDGLAALLAMLNSCAGGVTVTNIDNGFGAACAAMRIFSKDT